MKKIFFAGLLTFAGLCITIGFTHSRNSQTMSVRINIKDIPEHGLTIISPSNSSFDALMSAYTKANPEVSVELLKPFSIFIKNTGDRPVVAYKLRWACTKTDGAVIYKDSTYSASWVLMNEVEGSIEQAIANVATVIKPHSTLFLSLIAEPQPMENQLQTNKQPARLAAILDKDASRIQQLQQNPSETQILNVLNAELTKYTDITISIDGAFFADGSFVGTNDTGFFETIKAEISAKHDLLVGMQDETRKGEATEEIFKTIGNIANEPNYEIGFNSAPSTYYKHYQRMFAEEYKNAEEHGEGNRVIQQAHKQLSKPWPELRKL